MRCLAKYLFLSCLLFTLTVSAQNFSGRAYHYHDLLFSRLKINADSTLLWVNHDSTYHLYLVYEGRIKHFHKDIYQVFFKTKISEVGWGLLDEATGQSYRHAQVFIDTVHQKRTAPVFIEYEDGSRTEYLFKGQLKLDTLKLNAQQPNYKVLTNYKDPFTALPVVCSGSYTNNVVITRDTSDFSILVRFKKDSLITVPTSRYKLYNTLLYLRQHNWKPVKKKVEPVRKVAFDFPDMRAWRLPGDSLIYSDILEIKYRNDTVHEKNVRQYWKGRYIGDYSITKDNGTTDSSLYKNTYDDGGQLIGITTRWHQALTCDSLLGKDDSEPYWGYSGEKLEVERIEYPCPRYSYSIIRYSKKDTIGVRCQEDYNHEYRLHSLSCDTTWYFSNGLKHLEKHYSDTSLNHVWKYHYVYNNTGKLDKYSVRVTHTNGYEVAMLYTVTAKDTAIIKTTTRYRSDSTQGEYIVYTTDPKTKIYCFKSYQNNQVVGYAVTVPIDSLGEGASLSKSFNKDSVLISEETQYNSAFRKKSKGRLEQWSYGRDTRYFRYDTLKTEQGFVVKGYTGFPSSYPRYVSVPIEKCHLATIEIQDRFRRPLIFTEYEDATVKRKIKYSYSK